MSDLFSNKPVSKASKASKPARKTPAKRPVVFSEFDELSHYQDFKKIFAAHSRGSCTQRKVPVQDLRFSPLFIKSTMSDEN